MNIQNLIERIVTNGVGYHELSSDNHLLDGDDITRYDKWLRIKTSEVPHFFQNRIRPVIPQPPTVENCFLYDVAGLEVDSHLNSNIILHIPYRPEELVFESQVDDKFLKICIQDPDSGEVKSIE